MIRIYATVMLEAQPNLQSVNVVINRIVQILIANIIILKYINLFEIMVIGKIGL
jgi:hypothetical protein